MLGLFEIVPSLASLAGNPKKKSNFFSKKGREKTMSGVA
jgi:hypothetical protein